MGRRLIVKSTPSGMKEGARGTEPPSCDLEGAQPSTLHFFLEIRAYKNHYFVVKGCFRLKNCREIVILQDIGY